ncbi:MAG: carboxylating nicotinate-nucleotide diphosphorylase [Luminiphilus sp.]
MPSSEYITELVALALEEDVGTGDITAGLISPDCEKRARVITREAGILCGTQFVDGVFRALDPQLEITWYRQDGDPLAADDLLFTVAGNARAILTGERAALNFLQLLSGTASLAGRYASEVAGTGTRLLDTRKTVPGLRQAQKYAVACGGCHNHRIGLFDAFLIKENHIEACGGITPAVARARELAPGKPVEVEVENLPEMQQAIDAGADRIMLDNFDVEALREAVAVNAGRSELEASGNIGLHNLRHVAETGVDFISIGALTKTVAPLDLSMRLES